ncbi:Cell division control protein 2 [Ranunculus cassubicifolius]
MKKTSPSAAAAASILFVITICAVMKTIQSEPRAQVVDLRCGTVVEHNTSIYVKNFISTMGIISDQMQSTGFGSTQIGTGPDANYGLAQCYGDLTLADCVLCWSEIHKKLPECFPYNSGRIYLDGCFMRLQNYSFFEEFKGVEDKILCGNTTQKDLSFQDSTRKALFDATLDAPSNGGFAKPVVSVSGRDESVYVLANCWKTVNGSACKACLDEAAASAMTCLPWSEGRVMNTGCFLRYSDIDFLNHPQSISRGSKLSKNMIIAIVVSSVAAALVGALVGTYIRKRMIIHKKRRVPVDKVTKSLRESDLNFKFSTLERATGFFDDANKLGQGGFGIVYKGVLADGRDIAVKRLYVNNKHRAQDFYNEVTLISSVNHKNLVRLLGCSCSGSDSLLVYEYLPNKSLDRFLFDDNRGKALSWQKRFDIIIGTAEGLAYLHENENVRIIHRDIKASNILLDSKLQAKIADFGLARIFEDDKTHITTAIAGTLGYMAPEYLAYGQLTEKADVYSFGVLLLEIVSGRQNNKSRSGEVFDSLVISAWKHFQLGTTEEIFDTNLMLQNYSNSSYVGEEISRVVQIGLLCTQQMHSLRPVMSTALQMLSKKEELPAPSNPPFVDEKTMELNDTSEDSFSVYNLSSNYSIASMSFSGFHPR